MLTINLIREKKDFVTERLKIKNFNAGEIIAKILALDSSRREIQLRADTLQGEMNRISKEIGDLMKQGKRTEADAAREKTYSLKEEIKSQSDKLPPLENELRNEIIKLPNLPYKLVKPGHGADDNEKVKEGGMIPYIA